MTAVLLLGLGTSIPALAADSDGFADEYYRLNDLADILSDSEEAQILAQLDEISERQQLDVTIATVENLEGYEDIAQCADTVYEYCNYGYGAERDGVLLLLSMEERDWAISTSGYGITVFTDAGIAYIGKQMKGDLSDGNYAAAFATYAKLCDSFITQARNGAPFDKGNLPREPLSVIWLAAAVVIGVGLALLIVGGMKGQLKTVRAAAAANSYLKKDSLAVTERSDLFLYHTVKRTEQKKESDTGSSTHTSASGKKHGGGSGKF